MSNFTFLRGASHPDEMVQAAASLGHAAATVTDLNSLAGAVRGWCAARAVGLPYRVGCALMMHVSEQGFLEEGPDPLRVPGLVRVHVFPTTLEAYGRLCRMLTLGKRRAPKGRCHLAVQDLLAHAPGLQAVYVPPRWTSGVAPIDADAVAVVEALREALDPGALSVAACFSYGRHDATEVAAAVALARHVGVPVAATNHAEYHRPDRRMLHDVVACIRHGCTLDQAGYRLTPHAERCHKPPHEMARLFADLPEALARTIEVADACCGFDLSQVRYQYPDEVVPRGRTPMQHLTDLTRAGEAERFPNGTPPAVADQLCHELALIDELGYAHYFLTVHDLVRYARSRGILCQGRGAAANSVVCYCLGVTDADPRKINALFERFVSRERDEPPDIDIDFEHERREEVIQYLYRRYGRHRAALTAEVVTYRSRLAIREVGKVLGFDAGTIDKMAKGVDWWTNTIPDVGAAAGPATRSPARGGHRLGHWLRLVRQLQGFPRHLSQHVGGFVITQQRLDHLVPIENASMPDRTVIEWDKDDIDAMGMIKVDVLGLGMLTCLRKALGLIAERGHTGPDGRPLTVATLPPEDPAVYDMVCAADTVGVFQIESRAQMSMLPRLRPRCYYDLVIEVAIVRPGPIQGKMVHPYLRRRDGLEAVDYPSPVVERILGKTLGVPLFQEQAMQMAIDCAGFTPDEADRLRRAVTGFRHVSLIYDFGEKIVGGMLERGYPRAFAERVFEQIKGFSTYGFPESHAASFALLVYASAWIKCHHPAAFGCALLNSMPMGFYGPAQIVRDLQQHRVRVLPVDVNHSGWDCRLIDDATVRLGTRRVKGLREADGRLIEAAVTEHGPADHIESLWRISGATASAFTRLAAADAFGSLGLDRQSAIWHARKLRDGDAPLFDRLRRHHPHPEPRVNLPELPPLRHVVQDYDTHGLSLRGHPIQFLRPWLDRHGAARSADLADPARFPEGTPVAVAGVCLVRQRPASAKKVTFLTLEDEAGHANLVVFPDVFDAHGPVARNAVAMLARGRIDRAHSVVHVVVDRLIPLDNRLSALRQQSRNFH